MADFTRDEVLQVVEDGRKCAGAGLREADLRGADLHNANLKGADLFVADLFGTDLWGADLRGADLRLARYNADTKWPEGFDPKAAGAWLVEDDD